MKNDEIINIQTNCTLSQYFGVQVMVVFYLRITSKPSYSYCCGFALANVILFVSLLLLLLPRLTLVTAEDGTGEVRGTDQTSVVMASKPVLRLV